MSSRDCSVDVGLTCYTFSTVFLNCLNETNLNKIHNIYHKTELTEAFEIYFLAKIVPFTVLVSLNKICNM